MDLNAVSAHQSWEGEIAATAAGAAAESAELTAYLVEHGIFTSVAGNLVEWWMLADARKTVAEAKVYALAHLRAVQEGENPRGQRLQGEQAIGCWVARLREHARAGMGAGPGGTRA